MDFSVRLRGRCRQWPTLRVARPKPTARRSPLPLTYGRLLPWRRLAPLLLPLLLIFNCNRLDAAPPPPPQTEPASRAAPDGSGLAPLNRDGAVELAPPTTTTTNATYLKLPEDSADRRLLAHRRQQQRRRNHIESDKPLRRPIGNNGAEPIQADADGGPPTAADGSQLSRSRALAQELIGLIMNNQLATIARRVREIGARRARRELPDETSNAPPRADALATPVEGPCLLEVPLPR